MSFRELTLLAKVHNARKVNFEKTRSIFKVIRKTSFFFHFLPENKTIGYDPSSESVRVISQNKLRELGCERAVTLRILRNKVIGHDPHVTQDYIILYKFCLTHSVQKTR